MSETNPVPPQPSLPPETPAPSKKRFRWWRFLLQVLLALITAALIYLIILPALLMPKLP